MSTTATADVMDQLAGLAPDSPFALLRRQRPDVVRHLQGSDEAIFAPRDDGGLTTAERAAAALRASVLLRDAALQKHYRARLEALDAGQRLALSALGGSAGGSDRRWQAILAHVDRVTSDPDSARREHIDGLLGAGLSPRAVLALSQLIAYVNFQSRVLAGLSVLRGNP
jgi:CMD domain protein